MTAKTTEVLRAATYIRVSTDEQANSGYGLDVQSQRCKAQIIAKGWEFVGEYSDAGISGTKDATKRPALADLLKAADESAIDAVVVLALDRLGRNTRLVLSLVETFSDAGVEIVSCKESLDTSTPQGRFVITMFAALAQLERDTIAERTTAGRNERGTIDGDRGGRLPMGYKRTIEGDVAVDEFRAGLVKAMFALRRKGKSLKFIASYLNVIDVKTSRNKQWHPSSVKEVLDNCDIYTGGRRGASNVRWPKIL